MTSETVCTRPEKRRLRPDWLPELPALPRKILVQVHDALEVGTLELAVMGIRTVIDLVVAQWVGDLGTFPQKLDALVSEGYISEQDRPGLAVVIDAGSAVVHRGHSFELSDIHLMLDCIEHLLFTRFVLPRRLQRLARSIPKRGRRIPRRPTPPARPGPV